MRIAAVTSWSLLPLLLIPAVAFGEIAMGDAIEWVTDSHPHVAVVKIAATRGTGSKGAVSRILKGAPPADPVFRDRAVEPGVEYLVFFDEEKKPEQVYDLDAPKKNYAAALSMDMTVLDTREKILSVVEARLRHAPAAASVWLEIPSDSGAWDALYGGSACYLAVPADPEVKAALVRAIDTSKRAWERAYATRKLSAFPGDDTVARLRALLEDPAIETMTRSDGHTETKFEVPVVRQAAWDALKELGVKAPKPKGYRDDYEIRKF